VAPATVESPALVSGSVYIGSHMVPLEFHDSLLCNFRTKFVYKLICSQLITTHYMATNKIIHVYFSHMTYLMSYVTSLNETCEWSYKLSRNKL
jgi:hypothetical protein